MKELDLNMLKEADLLTVDKGSLVDIKDININLDETKQNKILSFLEQIHNPYLFKCGDMVIKLKYDNDTTNTFEDVFINLLKKSQVCQNSTLQFVKLLK